MTEESLPQESAPAVAPYFKAPPKPESCTLSDADYEMLQRVKLLVSEAHKKLGEASPFVVCTTWLMIKLEEHTGLRS